MTTHYLQIIKKSKKLKSNSEGVEVWFHVTLFSLLIAENEVDTHLKLEYYDESYSRVL